MKRNTIMFVTGIIAILSVTLLGTHIALSSKTAWEWDEPVYTDVVRATLIQGYPSFLSGERIRQEYYAANPPFHFFVLAAWDTLIEGGTPSIEGHRLFSSIVATLTVMMAMTCVYQVTKRIRPTILVGVILATDGWFSYTSLLVKLDTSAIFIGLLGIFLFYIGLLSKEFVVQRRYEIIGGAVMGFATTYKHVAAVFVIALFVHWLYFRFWLRKKSFHGYALIAAIGVIVAYVFIMVVTVGDDYVRATLQQINRVTGNRASSGLNPSLTTALQVLFDTYVAFLGSVGISLFGGFVALLSVVSAIIGVLFQRRAARRETRKDFEFVEQILFLKTGSPMSFFITLTLTSIGFLIFIQLRNPHYLGYGIVPIAVVVASWIDRAMDGYPKLSVRLSTWFGRKIILYRPARVLAYFLITSFLLLNAWTIVIRVYDFGEKENVLQATIDLILERVPQGSTLIANEPICRALAVYDFRCVDFRDAVYQRQVDALQPDVIVVYTTPTTHPPQSNAISVLLSRTDPNADLLGHFGGWKRDNVSVIWVNPKEKPLPIKGG